MLSHAVGITSGKGGVLKTTLACHLAGIAAESGRRTLLVDVDPQGNAMFDLGYPSDGGQGLADAISSGTSIRILDNVRPNLDVIPGGPALDQIETPHVAACWRRLENALHDVASGYGLIVIDSPARELSLRRMILTAARCVVVPTGVDRASRVGLPGVAATINEVREATNPRLDVLAVVAGPIPSTHSRIRARARARLGALIGDDDLVASTVIRHAPLVAEQCRELGMLSTEFAEHIHAGRVDPASTSGAAPAVAADWRTLVDELLERIDLLPTP